MVSSEFAVVHCCASFHLRFKSPALCHQVCLVRFRIHTGKSRLLLLHDIWHEHELQNDMFHPVPTLVWMLLAFAE